MRPCSTRFLRSMQASYVSLTRIEIMSLGEVVLVANTVTGGTVTLDQNAQIRGRVSLSFVEDGYANIAPVLPSDPLAPYGNEMRVSRGILYPNGDEELISLGIFRIDDVEVQDTGDSLTVQVSGQDRSVSVSDAKFEDPYQVADGTNYATAIQDVLDAGVPGFQYNFATTGLTTPNLIQEEGADRWAFAQSMASAIGMTLYFDGDGICVLRPVAQLTADPQWEYSEGEQGLLVSANRRWSRQGAFNRVIMTGENTGETTPARGVATDDNTLSPTYYGGPFGKNPIFESSSMITTDEQASAAAEAKLTRELGTTQSINFGGIVNPALEPDDLLMIRRERAGLNETHILDSVSLPLTADQLLTGATRAVQIQVVGA